MVENIVHSPILEYPSPRRAFDASSESPVTKQELQLSDLFQGADPYVHFDPVQKMYSLLWHQGESYQPGVRSMALLRSQTLQGLSQSTPEPLSFQSVGPHDLETWAPELHTFNGKQYLYIAASDGSNQNHRMHVYEAESLHGPYVYKGKLTTPDDSWAIDLTVFSLPSASDEELYGVWSGWPTQQGDFPQNLYIAAMDTPWTFAGDRHLLAEPDLPWMQQVAPILEGPQAIQRRGRFEGLTFAADASWDVAYTTGAMWYRGGDPLDRLSWARNLTPLFPKGHGIGHGMFVPGQDSTFLAHRKMTNKHGWDDRVVTMLECHPSLLTTASVDSLAVR